METKTQTDPLENALQEEQLELFAKTFGKNRSIEIPVGHADYKDNTMRLMLGTAIMDGFITVQYGIAANIFSLTTKGVALVEGIKIKQQAKAVVEALDEDDEGEFYPLLFKNKQTGAVVLAINNTSGTIVKVADTVEEDTYPLPLGTFQTCFIPFYVTDVWERMGGVTIDLTGKGE